MTRKTPEEKAANRFAKDWQMMKQYTLGRCVSKIVGKEFQKMIRIESAVDLLDSPHLTGHAICVSCGDNYHYKEMHGGHYVDRNRRNTIFDEMNCHPQCVDCNSYGGNGQVKPSYDAYMLAQYGEDAVEALKARAKITRQWTKPELAELRIGFMDRIAQAKRRLNE
jgi:hypothetical protein